LTRSKVHAIYSLWPPCGNRLDAMLDFTPKKAADRKI
jgi:hypothetical protein